MPQVVYLHLMANLWADSKLLVLQDFVPQHRRHFNLEEKYYEEKLVFKVFPKRTLEFQAGRQTGTKAAEQFNSQSPSLQYLR